MLSVPKIGVLVFGSMLISIGINCFLTPYQVLDGGVIGIGLILHYLFGVKVGLSAFYLSIPIFLLAWFQYKELFYNSLYGLIILSLIIDFAVPFRHQFLLAVRLTPFSSSVIGGFIIGLGIGIMLRYETSTGGTDLLAKYLSKCWSVNAGVLIFVMDALIVCIGGLLLEDDTFLLSLLTITAGGVSTSLCTLEKSNSV